MSSTEKLSRSDLYELVWTKPMRQLAAEFGLSDVALAKTCRRMNVPRPGRGYWARVAAKQRVKRPPLPHAAPRGYEWFVAERNPTPSLVAVRRASRPRVKSPEVMVARTLENAHDAVIALAKWLRKAEVDGCERLLVPGRRTPTFAVTVAHHRRALLILDALFKACEERNMTVLSKRVVDEGKGDPETTPVHFALAITTGELHVECAVTELLESTPIEPRRETAKDGMSPLARLTYPRMKRRQRASGRLRIEIDGISSWSDGQQPVEQRLGRIVAALQTEPEARCIRAEEVAREQAEAERLQKEQAAEAERKRQEREAERRRIREAEAHEKYRRSLERDLHRAARAWKRSNEIRAFLEAVEEVVPVSDRGEGFRVWLEWADAYAVALDPLSAPHTIARDLDPTAAQLGLDE